MAAVVESVGLSPNHICNIREWRFICHYIMGVVLESVGLSLYCDCSIRECRFITLSRSIMSSIERYGSSLDYECSIRECRFDTILQMQYWTEADSSL